MNQQVNSIALNDFFTVKDGLTLPLIIAGWRSSLLSLDTDPFAVDGFKTNLLSLDATPWSINPQNTEPIR